MKKISYLILAILIIAALFLFLNERGLLTPGNTIVIKTEREDIRVKNFYKQAQKVYESPRFPYVLMRRTEDYDMLYFPKGPSFLITLSRKPLSNARERAQNDFIETLGISKEQACQLTVSLKIPGFVDLDLAGKDYHLSFCPNGIAF